MANAVAPAPSKDEIIEIGGLKVKKGSNEHLYLSMDFDAGKKYMFELASKVPEREIAPVEVFNRQTFRLKHRPYNAYQNIVLTSQIVWGGQRVIIRYYDGCDSIFVSQQPKEKDIIDQLIGQTKRRAFLEGKFGIFGDEKMLLLYMMICSWNADSPFRTRTSTPIFISMDRSKAITAESKKLDAIAEALELAKKASETKMFIHGGYLGISEIDDDSGNQLTPEEFRVEYRKRASGNPVPFIESYGNKAIEVRYYINKAFSSGLINNKHNPNKATWGERNTEVCDISGLRSSEAICDRIFEFSQTAEGEEFVIQLKAIYS